MVELIWTEPALNDLDAIADYIALDKPAAASEFVKRVFDHVEQLIERPESGSYPPELGASRYRQIVEPPCRIFYRHDGTRIFVLSVIRGEKLFRKAQLLERDCTAKGKASQKNAE